MRKNTNKKDYNYDKNKDIEKRVQVAKETCNSEEEIELAIERSKQKLKSNPAPNGYSTSNEFSIIVAEEDVDRAFTILKNLKTVNKLY